jgi:hypothetical protein
MLPRRTEAEWVSVSYSWWLRWTRAKVEYLRRAEYHESGPSGSVKACWKSTGGLRQLRNRAVRSPLQLADILFNCGGRRFKSSRPDSRNEVGKRLRKSFLPRFICLLILFHDFYFDEKCSNCCLLVSCMWPSMFIPIHSARHSVQAAYCVLRHVEVARKVL